jgi:hypothetical protein
MDMATLFLMLGLAYGLGLLWYDLLPARVPERVWRVAAYPFIGIYVAETLLPQALPFDPTFGGLHLIAAFVGSFLGVIVDWIITEARHPMAVVQPEARMAAGQA